MKKSLILAALLIGAGSAQAQLTSKKGEAYLPEAGDWSFGVDATPFLTYMGGLFRKYSTNFLQLNNELDCKYFSNSGVHRYSYSISHRVGNFKFNYSFCMERPKPCHCSR